MGRDPRRTRRPSRWPRFNPRARMGRDNAWRLSRCRASCFNPRARMGRDLTALGVEDGGAKVSIHAPAWGATMIVSKTSTRVLIVSIHAPAWGATKGQVEGVHNVIVSIHAPAWGATCCGHYAVTRQRNVSIHAPAWGATHDCAARHSRLAVSIHAPAWGATKEAAPGLRSGECFNPRARMGRDQPVSLAAVVARCFNPRARMGRDSILRTAAMHFCAFQSTRPHGARRRVPGSGPA